MTSSAEDRSISSWWAWDILHLTLTAVAAIVALVVLSRSAGGATRRESGRRLPPGPRPWPIVGNLGALGALMHRDLAKLAGKYGPILSLRLGSVRTIVISSPQLAEEVLKTHDRVFAYRPRTSGSRILFYDNESIGFAPHGPYWRHARKVFTLGLFTTRRTQSFQAMRTEEVLHTLHAILEECRDGTTAVCMDDKFGELAWNIISRMLINKRFYSSAEADSSSTTSLRDWGAEYVQVFSDVVRTLGAIVIGDYIPLLRGFDVGGIVREMWEIRGRLDALLDKVIEDHKQKLNLLPAEGRSDDDKDIVDVLLTRPGGENDENPLTIRQIKAILNDGFVAGTDTSRNTLAWAMAQILRNPHVLQRAQQELDDVVGRHRLVQESDIPRLPYLQAVVKETFRLHPVVPLLLPHESVEDCEVGGYFIPAGTRVFINAWAIQRDAAVWDRALEFRPERFLGNDMDVTGQDFELIPFGSGRRSCPGRSLGLVAVQYALAVHLHACNWILPGGMGPEDVDLSAGPGVTSPLATPLRLMGTARLPRSVLHPGPTSFPSPTTQD